MGIRLGSPWPSATPGQTCNEWVEEKSDVCGKQAVEILISDSPGRVPLITPVCKDHGNRSRAARRDPARREEQLAEAKKELREVIRITGAS